MNLRRIIAPVLIALAGLTAGWGCSKKITPPLVGGNQPPTVRITSAPLDTTQRNKYVITINWIGFDPDGRVDHFLLAIDPPKDPGSDTLWETTNENTTTRFFPSPLPDQYDFRRSSDFHVVVIKAVDDKGAISAPAIRAFWSYTIAPLVRFSVPPASTIVEYYLPPSVLFKWEGNDLDGVRSQKPVKYKFTMITDRSEFPLQIALSDPDSVRRYYAPRYWAGWDSLPGDTTQKQFTGLTPDQEYVFVVVAFDEVGAFSPIFSFGSSMISFRITYAGIQNPRIGLFNEFFLYEYAQGSFRPDDPGALVEVPADQPLTFNWYASPATDQRGNQIGGPISGYRWAVDIVDLADETGRTSDDDLSHWSQWSTLVTKCEIGPYPGSETHSFYLEAQDVNGLVSLGRVQFTTVRATLGPKILVVNDTRFQLDRVSPGTDCFSTTNRPSGLWPTKAELDTFLFARGGYPWKCYPPRDQSGQSLVMSPPGLFNGYDFDTIGTNLRIQDLTIRLSRLGAYGHVVWLTDGDAAFNSKSGSNPCDIGGPMTSMRYMNDNRKSNTLAAYVRQGGMVWLAGGGALTASLNNFDRLSNNTTLPLPRAVTFRNTDFELIPGRFVYDQGHWRSEFKFYKLNGGKIKRYLGRFESNPGIYAGLPVQIEVKNPATDPFPPNRVVNPSNFYQTLFPVEFLSASNEIQEDRNPDPLHEDIQSTLDTLYKVTGAALQPDTGPGALQSVTMTNYIGGDNTKFIISGFSIWTFKRAQCQALVDFVLKQLWGVRPISSARPASPAWAARGPAGRAPTWTAPASPRTAPLRQAPRPTAPANTGPRD